MISMIRLDHLVLTVASIEATCDFYVRVLGMSVERLGDGRIALRFGAAEKIDLHPVGGDAEIEAGSPTPGSVDLCFIAGHPLNEMIDHVRDLGLEIVEGPVMRTGATGAIRSIYLRDPDQNLIEVAEYII
jgi:catechol 2,3-dioxygenase-like lactoylglutathione lyase family enzyme